MAESEKSLQNHSDVHLKLIGYFTSVVLPKKSLNKLKKNECSDHWCHLLVAVGPKTICSGKKLTLCLLKFIGWKLVRRAILIYMAKRIIDATFAAWSFWERNPVHTNRGKMAALDFSQQTNSPLKSLNQLQSASTVSLMIWVLFLTWFV